MDVSIIIVSFNSRSVLEPCLESIKRQSIIRSIEVIVVDNASTDGTAEMVRDRHPWIRLIAGGENIGFSRAVNLGIGEAQGRYFLILNPDTIIRDEDAIRELVIFMDRTPDAGIAGPKLVFHDGNLQYSCRRFYNWKVLLLRRTPLGRVFKNSRTISEHLMLEFDHSCTRAVDWILGACMLVRREAVLSVGLMDERFFLYFEDVDWCYRMKQKGWKVYYHPKAVVIHDYARESAHAALNRSFVAHLASLIRYYEKWSFILYFFKRYREVIKIVLFLALDISAFNLAFLSAYYLRVALSEIFSNPIFPIAAYERFVVFENLLFIVSYFTAGLYRIRRGTSAVDELFNIGRTIAVASALLMTSTYLSQIRTYSRMVVAFIVPFATVYDWGLRTMIRRFHGLLLAQKIDLTRVCLVGPEAAARVLGEKLASDPALGVEIVGVVSTDVADKDGHGRSLGDLAQLEEIIDRYRIQELVFLPAAVPDERIAEFIMMGRRRVVDVKVLTDYSGLVIHQAGVADLAGRPVITYQRDTRYVLDKVAKRILDVSLALVFLVASFPFFVVYSVYSLMRGVSPFARERRLGLGGKPFTLPITGTGSTNGPSDIVNLPLFWLVLSGKLSMVGPYPLAPEDSAPLGKAARFRFDVRPGVTGFWRVGRHAEIPVDDLLAQDANYARNWSLVQDMKILAMTGGNIVAGRQRSPKIVR